MDNPPNQPQSSNDSESNAKQLEDVISKQDQYIKQLELKLKEQEAEQPTFNQDKERKALLDLVKKNQEMVLKTKQEAMEEKQKHQQEIEALKNKFQQQSYYLSKAPAKEEKSFASEDEKDKFYANMRQQLVDELSKVEKQGKQKVEECNIILNDKLAQIERLNTEIKTLKSLSETDNKEWEKKRLKWEEEKNAIITDYEQKLLKKDKEIQAMQTTENSLKEEVAALKMKVEELSTIKCVSEVEVEARISAESKKIYGDLEEIMNSMKGEIKEKTAKIKSLEESLQTSQEAMGQKYNLAINEKRLLDTKTRKLAEQISKDKADYQNEVETLRKQIAVMLTTHSTTENMLKDEVNTLKATVLDSQKEYTKKIKTLNDQLLAVEQVRDKMRQEIEKTQKYLRESFNPNDNINNIQKKEIEALQSALELKQKEVDDYKLRAMSTNSSRKNLTSTLERMNTFVKNAEASEEKAITILNIVSESMKEIDNTHSKEEEFHMEQINTLLNEINKLRIAVKSYQEKNYEDSIAILSIEITKLKVELSSAKEQLLIQINSNQAASNEIVDEQEIGKLKMDVKRLNEENALEIKNKQQLEAHYASQVGEYSKRLMQVTDDYHLILGKFTTLEESVNSKRLDDFKLWRKRNEELKKTNAVAETKLNDLVRKCNEISKYQNEKELLMQTDLDGLREAVKKLDSFWESKQEDLEKENKELKEFATLYQEKATKSEEVCKQDSSLCFAEFESLSVERQELKELVIIFNSTVESLHNIEAVFKIFMEDEKKDTHAKLKLLEETYKTDIELLNQKITTQQNNSKFELQDHEAQYKEQLSTINDKLEVTEFELSSVKKELKADRETLKTLEQTKYNEVNKYINEVMRLKIAYAEKQQSIKRDKAALHELLFELNKKVESGELESLEKRFISIKEGAGALKAPMSNSKIKGKVEDDIKELQKCIEKRENQTKDEKSDVLSLSNQIKGIVVNMGKESEVDKKAFESELDIIKRNYQEKEKKLGEDLMNVTKERDTLLIKVSDTKADLNNSSSASKVSPKSNSKFIINPKKLTTEEKKFMSKTADVRGSAIKK